MPPVASTHGEHHRRADLVATLRVRDRVEPRVDEREPPVVSSAQSSSCHRRTIARTASEGTPWLSGVLRGNAPALFVAHSAHPPERPDRLLTADWHDGLVRITVRVRPGASRTRVGGRWGAGAARGGAGGARAVEGAAAAAVGAAAAVALGGRAGEVGLVSGERSRTKVLEVDIDAERGRHRLEALLALP